MSYIEELYNKQEKIYKDCVEINDCGMCPHCNGNFFKDCELMLLDNKIEEELKRVEWNNG